MSLLRPSTSSFYPQTSAWIRQASTSKGKSRSSKQWVARQSRDPFVRARQASPNNFRARSAYKLMEIDTRFRFLGDRTTKVVVDLGAAPGGWSQVVAERLFPELHRTKRVAPPSEEDEPDGKLPELTLNKELQEGQRKGDLRQGEGEEEEVAGQREDDLLVLNASSIKPLQQRKLVSVDLLPISPIPGANILKGDFLSPQITRAIGESLYPSAYVDVVLSDMAPNMSGNRLRDIDQSLQLCTSVFHFAQEWLITARQSGNSRGGWLVMKYFDHPELQAFRKEHLEPAFRSVFNVKPTSSRSESSEVYWVCSGFKGRKATV